MTKPPRDTVPCHDGDDRRLFLLACDTGRDGEPIAIAMADVLHQALDALEEKRERDHTGRRPRPPLTRRVRVRPHVDGLGWSSAR